MAHQYLDSPKSDRIEDLEPHSPRADYGLDKDDGFDPSKYDFYNPSNRTAGKAFVVTLDDTQTTSHNTPNGTKASYTEIHEFDSPSPLSPIEELDDDFPFDQARTNSDPGPQISGVNETSNPDEFDLTSPSKEETLKPLEQRCELLFSRQHLQLILADARLSLQFADFIRTYRPDSVPVLAYYLDSVKALRTIKYAESIIKNLEPIPGHNFTAEANSATMGWVVEDKVDRALDVLVKDDLPAFIAYIYVRTVDVALVDRVTAREDPKSAGIADGLAEVFVLSDPAQPDNPIVFTSEEFHTMTGYPRKEFLGQNCRILGGRRTSAFGISRFRASLDVEREHCEVLLNYRKDGSPFINLIMCVPLRDQSGKVRYYLGAQLDITDLVNDCTGMHSLKKLMRRHDDHRKLVKSDDDPVETLHEDEFEQLSEAFNPQELDKLVKLKQRQQIEAEEKLSPEDSGKLRGEDVASRTPIADLDNTFNFNGEGSAPPLGYYKTYLLVRPYPSLRILFASPDLRVPGILQSPLLNRIGGSSRVRDNLAHALEVGRKVTAKVQWLSKTAPKSRPRWIHCTPLLGANDTIGVWMVILVDDEDEGGSEPDQPPIAVQSSKQAVSSYTAEALPWDVDKQKTSLAGVSTSIWSDSDKPKYLSESTSKLQRKAIYQQPSDPKGVVQPPAIVRPGPTIAGKAYSFTSTTDSHTSKDDSKLTSFKLDRPTSSSSNLVPLQSTMQPKVKFAGRSSIEGQDARKPPVNMPYRVSDDRGEAETQARPPVRRTYKSLSPYGILFED